MIKNVGSILAQRETTYGDFITQARISQRLKNTVRHTKGWDRLEPYQRESIEMILHKISRILNGDPNYQDSWDDIAGYATLVSDAIYKKATMNKDV